jgi:hypothetical protein
LAEVISRIVQAVLGDLIPITSWYQHAGVLLIFGLEESEAASETLREAVVAASF